MNKKTDKYRRPWDQPILNSKGRHVAGMIFSGLIMLIIAAYVAVSFRNRSITSYRRRSPDRTFELATNPDGFYDTVTFYYVVAGVFLIWFLYTGFRLLFWNNKQH